MPVGARALFEGKTSAGEHQAVWDAAGLPSGIYFARLETGKTVETRKMTLLK